MSEYKWLWIGFAVMSLCTAAERVVSSHEEARIAEACVRAGGEWKVNLHTDDHECVRAR